MRTSARDQRLTALEIDFEPLLIKCLKECANGRCGLFGQNQQPESRTALHWPEAERLREWAEEIRELRVQFGQPNARSEQFLHYFSERGDNLPGEPKRARKFLESLGIDW